MSYPLLPGGWMMNKEWQEMTIAELIEEREYQVRCLKRFPVLAPATRCAIACIDEVLEEKKGLI